MKRGTFGRREHVSLISNNVCAQVKVDDIELVEQFGRKVHIFTNEQDYCCYQRIDNVAPALTGNSFYRAMNSVIINFDAVVRLEDNEVIFESGRAYAMGRNNYIKLRQAYKSYLMKYPPYVFHTGKKKVDCDIEY